MTKIPTLRSQGQYNLRNWYDFTLANVRTINCGVDRKYKIFRSKNLRKYSGKYKRSRYKRFKSGIKKWKPKSCPCRLRKTFLQQLGHM